MRRITFVLMLAVFALFSAGAFAGEQDFTLVNATGLDLHQLFVSPTSADEWQEDILGVDVLKDGASVKVTFNGDDSTAFWDLRVVDGDGGEAIWKKLNLKKISQVTIKFDDDDNPVAEVE